VCEGRHGAAGGGLTAGRWPVMRGRRRAASRARSTAGGVEGEGGRPSARQRTSGEMEATGRAVVFIAPPFSRGWGGDPRLKGL